jgi:hypothetical protein
MTGKTQKQPVKRRAPVEATAAARAAGKMFQPGVSPNPGGKPVGSRNRLQGDFVRQLAEDFAQHGKKAIVRVREDRPSDYLRVIASLMPKEIDVGTKFAALNDDEIAAGIAALQSLIAASGIGEGAKLALPAAAAGNLPTVQ